MCGGLGRLSNQGCKVQFGRKVKHQKAQRSEKIRALGEVRTNDRSSSSSEILTILHNVNFSLTAYDRAEERKTPAWGLW